jgi:hypothetical protein
MLTLYGAGGQPLARGVWSELAVGWLLVAVLFVGLLLM